MTRKELIEQIKQKESFLCVGLDTDAKKMPQCVFDLHDPIFEFNKAIIDATAPYCVAYNDIVRKKHPIPQGASSPPHDYR